MVSKFIGNIILGGPKKPPKNPRKSSEHSKISDFFNFFTFIFKKTKYFPKSLTVNLCCSFFYFWNFIFFLDIVKYNRSFDEIFFSLTNVFIPYIEDLQSPLSFAL